MLFLKFHKLPSSNSIFCVAFLRSKYSPCLLFDEKAVVFCLGLFRYLITQHISLFQYERECHSLRQSKDELERKRSELEQRCHELTQKLRVSELAVQELEGASGQCSQLEEKLGETDTQLRLSLRNAQQLEEVCISECSVFVTVLVM